MDAAVWKMQASQQTAPAFTDRSKAYQQLRSLFGWHMGHAGY